ncbi:MAG: DUF3343 domain-containing protein [Pyramidobacter sp.]|nr:DUF3343 domain-containing protein [Pyramidobacter sp.]
MQCIATFDVTTMALMFEKYCRASGYSVKIVPVPRQISASCGLACSFPCDKENEIVALCSEKKIEVAARHKL